MPNEHVYYAMMILMQINNVLNSHFFYTISFSLFFLFLNY